MRLNLIVIVILFVSFTAQLKPSGELDFRPTPEFPALQYLDSVDPGSVSDKAGLKAGDFILEVIIFTSSIPFHDKDDFGPLCSRRLFEAADLGHV